jgi:hypothetical protein
VYIKCGENDPYNYFPIRDGLKPSTVGLKKLPMYSDPKKDSRFQFDNKFALYHEAKVVARNERLPKYYQNTLRTNLTEILKDIIQDLSVNHADNFAFMENALVCRLTGDELTFDDEFNLVSFKSNLAVPFVDALDAISMQISEDLVIHAIDETGDFASAIHLCHPNGWSAEQFIGLNFQAIHEGVPRMEKIVPKSLQMVRGIISSPFILERVAAISFRTDTLLNRHPEVPDHARHMPFDKELNPNLFMRLERQTVTGYKNSNAFLFTIKTYFVDCNQKHVDRSKHECIRSVFEINDPLVYSNKFINTNQAAVLSWLDEL